MKPDKDGHRTEQGTFLEPYFVIVGLSLSQIESRDIWKGCGPSDVSRSLLGQE